jgi:hypothetical protein
MYEIRRVARFNSQLDALAANFHRLNQAIEMMEIVLSRNPEGAASWWGWTEFSSFGRSRFLGFLD